MRLADVKLHLDCAALVEGSEQERITERTSLVRRAADLLHSDGFVIFRLGRLRLDAVDSRSLAAELTASLRGELVRRGAPDNLRVEQDKAQETYVPHGHGTRTLLPHHDGQHCSYLTPSRRDDEGWSPQWREFGSSNYTTTPAHKMYQGVFLTDPGDGLSITTYYDWLDVLATVYSERHGGCAAEADPAVVARWLGNNQRTALDLQLKHGCDYPSFSGMLGLNELVWNGLSFHHAEAPLSEEDRKRYPMAIPLTVHCPCGECVGDIARLFCHQMLQATGRNWADFRKKWEVLAPGERFDLLFGHNLTMLHGGLAGGHGRVIEPLCLVVDEPAGEQYEDWLAASWRRALPRPA
ncbi:hypothetical protein ASJ30_14500 [Janibacter indicus]|uniref:TauD/TfdA-like domain-containing protein n=1 Tax=Janibacter indicus TaxID=857417 RepID=A0A1L3MK73_9MICO|nr:hypothetical protein [Janibacter indicus]APH02594.1 hypothetical protein ASJ30_14500 [Janibacter indicus]